MYGDKGQYAKKFKLNLHRKQSKEKVVPIQFLYCAVLWTNAAISRSAMRLETNKHVTNVSSAYADSCLCCEYYMINLLVLLAKYHIHKSKCSNHKPFFLIFEKELKQYITTILHSINRKAIKTTKLCTLYNIFMN